MPESRYKPITPSRYKPIDIVKEYEQKLFTSLCIPSTAHAYSLCVEYMKNWAQDKFAPKYFKSVYVDGKHIFDDFRRMSKDELLKREKPALAIIPQIDYTFDRDHLDMNLGGIDLIMNRCNHKDAFFKDLARKTYIGITMESILMNFTYRIKVSTRSQATDLLKFMKMAFRVNQTQGRDVDMDFHVPYKLMLQLAADCGFKVVNNTIPDILGFMYYLNKHSELPFLYKLRNANGRYEFFMRVKDLYVHITTNDISCDDGERDGHVMTNFIVEMQAAVRFPCPKFYSYFSYNNHDHIRVTENDGTFTNYGYDITKVPIINAKGWSQFMTTAYTEEDTKNVLTIDFNELVGDLRTVLEYDKQIFISPSTFMDIKLFNNFKEKDIIVDWDKMTITTKAPVDDKISYIAFYVDLEYMNTQLTNIEAYNKNRLK